MIKSLSELISQKKVLEICTVPQPYHAAALKFRSEIAAHYKCRDIQPFLNPKYKFNQKLSLYPQKINHEFTSYFQKDIEECDIVILHSWRGIYWALLFQLALDSNKLIVFMNDMANSYDFPSIDYILRFFSDRLLVRPRLYDGHKNVFLVALTPSHHAILSKRFKLDNILRHTWHLAYIDEYATNSVSPSKPLHLIDSNFLQISFIARNIPRKCLHSFLNLSKLCWNSSASFHFRAYLDKVPSNALKYPHCSFSQISSIGGSSNCISASDVIYCPYKDEPLGLIPLEALSRGATLQANSSIPSLEHFPTFFSPIVSFNDTFSSLVSLNDKISDLRFQRKQRALFFLENLKKHIML